MWTYHIDEGFDVEKREENSSLLNIIEKIIVNLEDINRFFSIVDTNSRIRYKDWNTDHVTNLLIQWTLFWFLADFFRWKDVYDQLKYNFRREVSQFTFQFMISDR